MFFDGDLEGRARAILAKAQKGGSVPQDVQDAAIRVKNGGASEADKRLVAKFSGAAGGFNSVRRSIKTVREKVGFVTGSMSHISEASDRVEAARRSGNGVAGAQNAFISTVLSEV